MIQPAEPTVSIDSWEWSTLSSSCATAGSSMALRSTAKRLLAQLREDNFRAIHQLQLRMNCNSNSEQTRLVALG